MGWSPAKPVTTHTVYLPIDPMPSPRPRFRVIGRFASAYMPANYKAWKKEAAELLSASGIKTGSTPVGVRMIVLAAKPRTSKLAYPRPDIDNYLKSILDAATEAGVWDDDTGVVEVTAIKRWALPDEKPGIGLEITEL